MTMAQTFDQRAEAILALPDASDWIKDAIRALKQRDPLEALNDVEWLCELMWQRRDE